jgi:uncharacterized lipoprotein
MKPLVKTSQRYWQAAGLVALAACAMMLASCRMFGHKEKKPLYYSAKETPPLEIPQGLDRPVSSSALVIVVPLAPLPAKEMQIVPPRVTSQTEAAKDGSGMRWSSEGVYLFVQDTQASVYRRLGLAIKRSELSPSEASVEGGYQFEYFHDPKDPERGFFSRLAFWRDDGPNYSGSYQAVTQADGENTRVFIKNADGSEPDQDAAEHLLIILGQRLG